MLSANRGIWQALIPLWFLLFGVFAPAGCACGPERQVTSSKTIRCRPQHDRLPVSPPLASRTIVPGTSPASFAVTDSGDAAMSMPLERNAEGTWQMWDTNLPIPPSPGRVLLADVNADGLPDAIANGLPDGRLRTQMNTGK